MTQFPSWDFIWYWPAHWMDAIVAKRNKPISGSLASVMRIGGIQPIPAIVPLSVGTPGNADRLKLTVESSSQMLTTCSQLPGTSAQPLPSQLTGNAARVKCGNNIRQVGAVLSVASPE